MTKEFERRWIIRSRSRIWQAFSTCPFSVLFTFSRTWDDFLDIFFEEHVDRFDKQFCKATSSQITLRNSPKDGIELANWVREVCKFMEENKILLLAELYSHRTSEFELTPFPEETYQGWSLQHWVLFPVPPISFYKQQTISGYDLEILQQPKDPLGRNTICESESIDSAIESVKQMGDPRDFVFYLRHNWKGNRVRNMFYIA